MRVAIRRRSNPSLLVPTERPPALSVPGTTAAAWKAARLVAQLAALPACLARLPTCLPAYLPTCLPAYLPTCLPAYLPTCLPGYLHT